MCIKFRPANEETPRSFSNGEDIFVLRARGRLSEVFWETRIAIAPLPTHIPT